MKLKKVAVASAVSALLAFSGSANAWTNFDDIVDEVISTWRDEVKIVTGAYNDDEINASINVEASSIEFKVGAPDVSATADATADAVDSLSNATATAIVGNVLSTTAIGAYNSATLEIDLTGLMDYETYAYGSVAATGEDIQIEGLDEDDVASAYTEDQQEETMVEETELISDIPSQLAGNFAGSDYENNVDIGIVNMAFNDGDIDASVNIIAASVEPTVLDRVGTYGTITLANMSITTTAIGAFNSSVTKLTASGVDLPTPVLGVLGGDVQ
jgi:hypothetical protein